MTTTIDLRLRKKRITHNMPNGSAKTAVYFAFCLAVVALSSVLVLAEDLPRWSVGTLGVLLFLAMLMMSIPVGVSMALSGILGLNAMMGWAGVSRSLVDLPYAGAGSWSLSVIPMFIFMGMLLWKSGATTRLFDAARAWLDWLPGSQALTVITAGAGLSSASGSTLGIAYAVGRIGLPEMFKSGYDKRLALGSVLMAGMPGQLIPPSLLLVIYAGIVNIPVGPQLMAGILPGILLVAVLMLTVIILVLSVPKLAPKNVEQITWEERRRTLARVWPVPLIVLIVIGGMQTGIFTPTEAGAVGALAGMILCFVYGAKGKRIANVVYALKSSVLSVGSLFLLMIGAAFINRMIALSGIPEMFADAVEAWGLSSWQVVIAALLIMLLLGMFMEPASMLLISVPVVLPLLVAFDVDLVWFGVLAVFVGELALLTPPVGVLALLVANLCKDHSVSNGQTITLTDVYKAAGWGLAISVVVIMLLFIFPEVSTWLPGISANQ